VAGGKQSVNGDRNGVPPMPAKPRAGLPETVRVKPGGMMSPQELRDVASVTGRPVGEILGNAGSGDTTVEALQAMVWTVLRRGGFDVTWDDAALVMPEVVDDELDPTNAEPSTP
jgi:hypothetical protein